jgi:hypothetical protein
VVFITSRRTWATASRIFIAVLVVVLGIGAFTYIKRLQSAAASAQMQASANASGNGTMAATPAPAAPAPAPEGVAMHAAGTGRPDKVVLPPMPPAGTSPRVTASSEKPAPAPTAPPTALPLPPKPTGTPVSNASKLLADAQAKLDAGDLLGVRALLNDAIVNDQLTGTAAEQARLIQATANNKLIFSNQPYPGDSYVDVVKVDSSNGLTKIAAARGIPWPMVCRVNGVSDRKIRMGMNLKAPIGPFHAVVTKSAYRLDLYLGGLPGEPGALYVTSLPVGLGKDNSTPTGLWTVARNGKMKNPSWTNPRTSEHYDGYDAKNPLGGYWIALQGEAGDAVGKTSYGIHGTIEPETIGKQASMGCVRLKVDDVAFVYDAMSETRSRVIIRD